MEEELSAGLRELQIAQFIKDQEVEPTEEIGGAALTVGTGLGIEFVHEVYDVAEPTAFAAPDAGSRDADREMRLAGSGAADEHHVALLIEEVAGGEVPHQRLVHRRVLEGELIDLLGQREAGDGQMILDRTCLLLADLGVQKITDDLLWLVLPLHGCGDDLMRQAIFIP